jgi:hypothetical protein
MKKLASTVNEVDELITPPELNEYTERKRRRNS